jgi:hypothetical protein
MIGFEIEVLILVLKFHTELIRVGVNTSVIFHDRSIPTTFINDYYFF